MPRLIKYFLKYSSFFVLLFVSIHAQAQEAPSQYQACIVCHGENGQGNPALKAPALAGQTQPYLFRQLQNFKNGIRGNDEADVSGMQMRAMVISLSDEDAEVLATYLSGLPHVQQTSSTEGDVQLGKKIYNGNCGSCHGPLGEGNIALKSPALDLLDAEYFVAQFNKFKDKIRGSHEQDKQGRQMQLMANSIADDKDLVNVISYLHGLERDPSNR